MIHAYQEMYLNSAMTALGDAFDYAVNTCGMLGIDFVKCFLASSISKRLENGEPQYLVGKTGAEIVHDIIEETKGETIESAPFDSMQRSPEYWIGWAVAYYQWYSGRPYSEIFSSFEYGDIEVAYNTLHEADISKFVDVVDEHIRLKYPDTNLKRIRKIYGYSQSELAKSSGVSLRSIQMYEQRNKNINKASAETLFALSKSLGCSMEDLIEL